MLMVPETRYAPIGDSMIAFQTVGDGSRDLALLASMASNVEIEWESPALARQRERLASFSRLILFDRRGLGLSDPMPAEHLATYEHWNDDLLTVLDSVGSEHVSLLCEVDGGLWGLLFAATYPQRVDALVLWNVTARNVVGDDYPFGYTLEAQAAVVASIREGWGRTEWARIAHPDRDEADWRFLARWQRASITPAAAAVRSHIVGQIDVRSILSTIRVPTLVLHREGNRFVDEGASRYLADHIDGARFVQVPGRDVHLWDDEPVLDLIEEFLTGDAPTPSGDRVLATVLFTDIVGSTEQAADLGDNAWRKKLDEHDSVAALLVERYKGRFIKGTGDGTLATFEGPGKAIRCVHDLRDKLRAIGIRIRAGIHTGEIELRGGDIGGLAVHIAARVLNEAKGEEVWCSRTVKDLVVGSGITFEDRGARRLKGVPDEWQLFAVRDP